MKLSWSCRAAGRATCAHICWSAPVGRGPFPSDGPEKEKTSTAQQRPSYFIFDGRKENRLGTCDPRESEADIHDRNKVDHEQAPVKCGLTVGHWLAVKLALELLPGKAAPSLLLPHVCWPRHLRTARPGQEQPAPPPAPRNASPYLKGRPNLAPDQPAPPAPAGCPRVRVRHEEGQETHGRTGCDASVLLKVNPGGGKMEREAAPNNPSLRGRRGACLPEHRLTALTSSPLRPATASTSSTRYPPAAATATATYVPTEIDALSFLPGPNSTASDLVDGFGNKTLTAEEMVVLSGSQTIDRSVPRRQLPVPEPGAAAQRQHQPGIPGAAGWRCAPPTPASSRRAYQALLDNNYYKLLPLDLGLHFSDDQLIRNATLAPSVAAFAANETLWKKKFVEAMIKMGNIEVKTGAQGEVRLNCSIVNALSSSSSMIEMILLGSTDVSTS
ncbi:hypothetical protein EJB05_30712, partial [Eragrostis curvula]